MRADEYLKSKEIDFQLIKQKRPTFRCIDSADERDVSTKLIVKSMLVKTEAGFIQCLVPGHLDLNDEKLSSAVGPFKMAEAEEVESATGQVVGTVHPYVDVPKKLVDQRISDNETLSFTTGDPMEGIIIQKENFLKALGTYEVLDICSDPEEYLEELATKHEIQKHAAKFLVESESLDYFESVVDSLGSESAVEWLRNLVRYSKNKGKDFGVVKPDWLVEIANTNLTDFAKKDLILKVIESGQPPKIGVESTDLDSDAQKVIDNNAQLAEQYKGGDQKVLNFLVGQVMRETKGAFDPKEVRSKLLDILGN